MSPVQNVNNVPVLSPRSFATRCPTLAMFLSSSLGWGFVYLPHYPHHSEQLRQDVILSEFATGKRVEEPAYSRLQNRSCQAHRKSGTIRYSIPSIQAVGPAVGPYGNCK